MIISIIDKFLLLSFAFRLEHLTFQDENESLLIIYVNRYTIYDTRDKTASALRAAKRGNGLGGRRSCDSC
jgi:hypothetical protein